MQHPPNTSGNPKGYNAKLFPNFRAVRKALRRLGYKTSMANAKAPASVVRQFQRDYNHCSIDAHPSWGVVRIDGKIDGRDGRHTLNALEISLSYALREAPGVPSPVGAWWQKYCAAHRKKRKGDRRGPVGEGKRYVEMINRHAGTLRRPGNDLRVVIHDLARRGKVLYALTSIPPQTDRPRGSKEQRWYPAIYRG